MTEWPADRALYGISVAAELTGVNPQTLRGYEARGLLDPHRTDGGTRRYSGHDLHRINEISTLLAAGLNLAGIAYVLDLQTETRRLQAELDELRPASGASTPAEPVIPNDSRGHAASHE